MSPKTYYTETNVIEITTLDEPEKEIPIPGYVKNHFASLLRGKRVNSPNYDLSKSIPRLNHPDFSFATTSA